MLGTASAKWLRQWKAEAKNDWENSNGGVHPIPDSEYEPGHRLYHRLQLLWVVIGTETGRRKGKSVSKPEQVRNLTHQAHVLGIPVFMKEDLLPIMGEEQIIQELSPTFRKELEEQRKWQK